MTISTQMKELIDDSHVEIKFMNTLSRSIEPFKSQQRYGNTKVVKIYTCGPTVYSAPHIGNLAAYVYWDLLVRVLKTNGYTIKRVINLTDVGHLTSDGDSGEDKIEKGARKFNQTVWQIAEKYINEFKQNFYDLNLIQPEVWARATDYIPQDIKIVDLLTQKGYTYETSDGVYYDTSKFKNYWKFSGGVFNTLSTRARIAYSPEKKNQADFAVWKFIKPGEQHAMRWDYLGRPGYPGWHLECSTIIHEELGETIDIHCGGIDHIPVHHTNEIAQSEAAFDKKLAKYWLHCNFLTIDKQKISKSLGNIWTLEDLANRGYSPMDFKMWVLQGNYSQPRDFNISDLESARLRRLKWRNRIAECYQKKDSRLSRNNQQNQNKELLIVLQAVSDFLNSSYAFYWIDKIEDLTLESWAFIDELFGLKLIQDSPDINSEIRDLLQQRSDARATHDYAKSDELRELLAKYDILVKDTPHGQIWQYAK